MPVKTQPEDSDADTRSTGAISHLYSMSELVVEVGSEISSARKFSMCERGQAATHSKFAIWVGKVLVRKGVKCGVPR